ncbi:ATP-binding protein [uncultured Methanobrevibacter sp.]|uniref:ATP-binding protein n=1 Tax=uncultured Methanobrevibacter sp. TaxID=253161 RepID=UPI0025F5CBFE|nr:AAA family ATPase [uncultured Methanobrevibacter sp.]
MPSKQELINYIHAKQRETRILSANHLEEIDNKRLKFIKLKEHADNFLNTNLEYYNRFIMMSGLRGVGKTTILYQLYDYLTKQKNVPEDNIFYLDVHDLKSVYDTGIKEVFDLYLEDIHQTIPAGLDKKIFFFVDEAQLDENWADYARLLFNKTFNIFMIFTGSSALGLELNVDASRRITKEQLLPCSFQEYLLLKHNVNLTKNNFRDLILKLNPHTVDEAMECENIIKKDMIQLDNDPELEFKKYIHSQSFPFALNISEISAHRLTNDMVERIVLDDLKHFASFNNGTNASILRLISYLATKKPGTTSSSSLAQSLNLNVRTVDSILEALEKSQLIFSISAYGSAGKILNKPKQHFFLAPSIKSALNYRVGRYDLNHEKCYAVLVENMVASALNRLSDESLQSLGLFYDSNRKGVDFIVKNLDEVIPIEVGIGKKTKSQLTRAKSKYGAEYGILVSNRTSKIEFKRNILYVPVLTFALM